MGLDLGMKDNLDELLSKLSKYRAGWRPAGMVYDPDGPFVEWRHIVSFAKELLEQLEVIRDNHDAPNKEL